MHRLLAPLLLLAAVPAAASAQQRGDIPSDADRQAILAAVETIWTAMRTHDSTLLKTVMPADAQFVSVAKNREGKTVVMRSAAQEFISAVGKPGEPWNETMVDPEVRIDGEMATVWTYYEFRLGSRFSHCGYDLITLARLDGQWKAVALADTRQRQGCRNPT